MTGVKGKFGRVWANEGPDRAGAKDKLHLWKCALNKTVSAGKPIHVSAPTID